MFKDYTVTLKYTSPPGKLLYIHFQNYKDGIQTV